MQRPFSVVSAVTQRVVKVWQWVCCYAILFVSSPVFAGGEGFGGWAEERTKSQGQSGINTLYIVLQIIGVVLMAWGLWMVVQHNLDKKKGNTPNTSWMLVMVLVVVGAMMLGFTTFTKKADETAWGSSGGDNQKITIN